MCTHMFAGQLIQQLGFSGMRVKMGRRWECLGSKMNETNSVLDKMAGEIGQRD